MISSRVLVPATLIAGVIGGVTVANAAISTTPVWFCTPTTTGQPAVSGGTGTAPSCGAATVVGRGFTFISSGNSGKPEAQLGNIDEGIDGAPATALTINTPTADGVDVISPTGSGVTVSGAGGPGVSVTGTTGPGVSVSNSHGTGVSVSNNGGTGVAIAQHGGTGLAVTNSSGPALNVSGVTNFSRSGLATIGAHKRAVTIPNVALAAASKVFATLQTARSGVAIEGVTKHPTSVTITLTKASKKPLKVAWFVIG